MPSSGADLETAASLADIAVGAIPNHPEWTNYVAWGEFAKGLAEYRRGRFASARDWMETVLAHGDEFNRDAAACMVVAMAQYQLKQTDEARNALAKGIEIEQTKLPKLESGDIGGGRWDWIIAHALLREAKELIEGP